jgi:hypothetical protein
VSDAKRAGFSNLGLLGLSRCLKLLLDLLRVSKVDAMSQANIVGAGRDKALIDPVITHIALLGNGLLGIIPNGVVRASG